MKDLNLLRDQSLVRSYESIREQVAADARGKYRFMGPAAKERANILLDELRRRGLVVHPIEWPEQHEEEYSSIRADLNDQPTAD